MKRPRIGNPFYPLLIATGLLFTITAIAYGVMAVGAMRISVAAPKIAEKEGQSEHLLIDWLRRHGETALLGELACLGLFTFAAIGTDSWWEAKSPQEEDDDV